MLKALDKFKMANNDEYNVKMNSDRMLNKVHVQNNKAESLFEINRKNKIKHTKKVYSVCADFHSGLNILALSLIDKEVKLYKLKQNGARVIFMELFSFHLRFIVSCLHIE